MIRVVILFLILHAFVSCRFNDNVKSSEAFIYPVIINSVYVDTIQSVPFEAEFISEVFPVFVGKFKFGDSIDVDPGSRDSIFYNDFITHNSTRYKLQDSLGMSGFELKVDYETTIAFNSYYRQGLKLYDHYPVYCVNSTNNDLLFVGKDGYAFGLQEAIDDSINKDWRPIEGRGFDFCGNGGWGIIVHPNEFVVLLMRKYKGDFETELRVRFEIGVDVFVSKPFIGKINKCQFLINDSSYYNRSLQMSEGASIKELFYGAIPK